MSDSYTILHELKHTTLTILMSHVYVILSYLIIHNGHGLLIIDGCFIVYILNVIIIYEYVLHKFEA